MMPSRDQLLALLEHPPIADQMPIRFGADESWHEFKGSCTRCRKTIPAAWVRGTINRPVPGVAVIEAAGFCEPCMLLVPYHYRLHAGGRLSGIREGRWVEWRSYRPLWSRVLSWLAQIFGSNRAA